MTCPAVPAESGLNACSQAQGSLSLSTVMAEAPESTLLKRHWKEKWPSLIWVVRKAKGGGKWDVDGGQRGETFSTALKQLDDNVL